MRLYDCVVVFIHEKENWQPGSVFPAFCTPLSTMLWSRAAMYPEWDTLFNVSRSGYIWFYSRPRDQESTNGSPCLVEWNSRNITNKTYVIRHYWCSLCHFCFLFQPLIFIFVPLFSFYNLLFVNGKFDFFCFLFTVSNQEVYFVSIYIYYFFIAGSVCFSVNISPIW